MNFRILFFICIFLLLFSVESHCVLPENLNDLGITAYESGNLELAETYFNEAVKIKPEFAEAYNNLGLVEFASGNIFNSIKFFIKAIKIRKDFKNADSNLKELIKVLGTGKYGFVECSDFLSFIEEFLKKEEINGYSSFINDSKLLLLKNLENMKENRSILIERIIGKRELTQKEAEILINYSKTLPVKDVEEILIVLVNTEDEERSSLRNLTSAVFAESANNMVVFNKMKTKIKDLPENNRDLIKYANKIVGSPSIQSGDMKEILDLIQKKRFFKAELRLKKMKRKSGATEKYLFLKAFMTWKRGMRAGARKTMSIFDSRNIDSAELFEAAGTLMAKIGMKEKALECFENGINRFQEYSSLYFKAALLHEAKGNLDIAKEYIDKALEITPFSHQYKYFAAQIYEKKGLFEEADKLKRKILEDAGTSKQGSMIRLSLGANPSDMLIIDWDYDLMSLKNDSLEIIDEKNIRKIEKNLFSKKINPELMKKIYEYYNGKNDLEESIAYLLHMRRNKINYKTLPWTIGEKFLKYGLADSAFRELSEFKNSETEEFIYLLAKSGILSGNTKEINVLFDKLESFVKNPLLISRISELRKIENEGEKTEIKKIIELRNKIIHKLLLLKNFKDTCILLDDNIKLGDIDSVILYGELLMESGKPDAALKKMKRFLRKNEANRKIYALMGEICYRVGSWNRGIKYYKKMMSFGKLRVRELIKIGDMYLKLKKYQEALLNYKLARFKTLPGDLKGEISSKITEVKKILKRGNKK